MTDEQLLEASVEDRALWLKYVDGLPVMNGFSMDGFDSNRQSMPFGCGPHCLPFFREVIEIVKPKKILEIGFFLGYSSACWISMSKASVVGVEISDRAETKLAAEIMFKKFGTRFHCIINDSAKVWNDLGPAFIGQFDLIFIDGGHLEENVQADIQLGLKLGIKWFAFDDWIDRFGPGVQPAVAKNACLREVKVLGNMALFENTLI